MNFNQFQKDFISSIFNQDREAALHYVKGDKTLTAAERLGIYRGSVHGILSKSLGETFPVCKALLGETFFNKMCDKFIDQYPPNSAFFTDYGDNFSLFLTHFEHVKHIPFISDVAHFEWCRQSLSQQTIPEAFDFSIISSLTEQQQATLVFMLNRSLRLLQSDFRIDLIWRAHQEDSGITLDTLSNEDISESVNIFMWKSTDSIKISSINKTQENNDNKLFNFQNITYWHFLNAVFIGSNITVLAQEFGEFFPDLLKKSIQDGWIESFTS